VWVPIDVTGVTYGTNGFYLDFSDTSNIGADRSGNGNNFTPTGFELTNTSSYLYDWVSDSPTDNRMTYDPLQTFILSGLDRKLNTYEANRESSLSHNGTSYINAYLNLTWPSLPEEKVYYFHYINGSRTSYNDDVQGVKLWASAHENDAVNGTGRNINNGLGMFFSWGISTWRRATRHEEGTQSSGEISFGSFGGTTSDSIGTLVAAWDGTTRNLWFGVLYSSPGVAGYTGDIQWLAPDGNQSATANPSTGTDPTFSSVDPSIKYLRWCDLVYQAGNYASVYQAEVFALPLADSLLNATATAQLAGFSKLGVSSEMPAVDITNPSDHFQTILAPGSGGLKWKLANTADNPFDTVTNQVYGFPTSDLLNDADHPLFE